MDQTSSSVLEMEVGMEHSLSVVSAILKLSVKLDIPGAYYPVIVIVSTSANILHFSLSIADCTYMIMDPTSTLLDPIHLVITLVPTLVAIAVIGVVCFVLFFGILLSVKRKRRRYVHIFTCKYSILIVDCK